MKIVIDARMWDESGIGRYLRNLIDQLQGIDKKNEYLLLLLDKSYNNINLQSNFKKIKINFGWYTVAEQIRLPSILNKLKPDLVHFPHFNAPIFYQGKFVVTIHDLIHQHFNFQRASTHGLVTHQIKQLGYKTVFGNAVKKSAKILTPSNFVKAQLIKEWGVHPGKIIVTPEAAGDKFNDRSKVSLRRKDIILKKFGIKPPFIFYVGNAHPHKNIEGLIKAFLNLRKKYQYLQLVLAGQDSYFWQRIKKESPQKDIIYTSQITDEELAALYRGAQVFVMPSFEEGFGIPLLEAMACGCPVVSSNGGSLPEVGGDAALYFDPYNIDNMVNKIQNILNSEKLRKDLIHKGKKRVKQFSWKKLAQQTLEVYQNASSIGA